MAPNAWDDLNYKLSNAADRVSDAVSNGIDELQGSSGYKFQVSLTRSDALPPWALAAIALAVLGVFVCLIVACCRCCCRSERGRVVMPPQPQPTVITQFVPAQYPMSPTPGMMQQPVVVPYSDNNQSAQSQPPAYGQDAHFTDSHKYPLLK